MNSTDNVRSTWFHWRLAVTICAAALGSSETQGQVTYINFSDITLVDPNPNTYNNPNAYIEFDLFSGEITHTNAGALPYMRITAVDDYQDNSVTNNAFRTSSTGLFMKTGVPITFGTIINSASGFGTFASMTSGYTNLSNTFLGFRIDQGGSNYIYGWVQISTGGDVTGNGPGSITIFDAAWENTLNQAIAAGSISSIPEPSIAVLGIGLAAGVLALRRRLTATKLPV